MRLTDEMKEMVGRLRLCYVATVTPDGKPNLSPKGSLGMGHETVVFADIASPGTTRIDADGSDLSNTQPLDLKIETRLGDRLIQ
jgi:predicted pyridoxine 5'-phosphate oxidase superfamily flavin-nucleotide-binding protein